MILKIIITKHLDKIMMASFDGDRMNSLSFYDADEDCIGSVYLSRVYKVLSNIDGCFLKYKDNKDGFLKSKSIKAGSILPLQLKKEGTDSKEPLFTDDITINSEYAVIKKGNPEVLVSSKIDKSLHATFIENLLPLSVEIGCKIIIRTNALNIENDILENDIRNLSFKLDEILKRSNDRTLYSKLYSPISPYIEEIRDFPLGSVEEIITDNEDIYNELINYYDNESVINKIDVNYYSDEMLSLFHLYKMDHNIKQATSRTILLKSGASIVIDETEALTAIDVNTHYVSLKGNKEDTFYQTNLDAAKEIIRQLRIRNLSGMIIIDFINMKSKDNYEKLKIYIEELSKYDNSGLKLIDVTGLKLFELVRTKKRKSLKEQMR